VKQHFKLPGIFVYRFLLLLLLTSGLLYAQDSAVSQVVMPSKFSNRAHLISAKYPAYSLLAGFVLIKEANNGDPFAQHELGLRYILKNGFPPDTAKGIYWIQKAVEQGIPPARLNYGIMLMNGVGVEWNPFEAYYHFKSAAEIGMPQGEYSYGLFYTDNFVVNRNMKEAYRWIKKAAEADYKPAIDMLEQFMKSGIVYEDNNEPDTEQKDYNSLFGSPTLMDQEWELDFYNFKDDSASVDKELIIEILNKNKNDLGDILFLPDSTLIYELPDTSGMGLVKYTAEKGNPEALLILGRINELGIGKEKDLIKASINYIRAFRLGSHKAGEYIFSLTKDASYFTLLKNEIDKDNYDAMYVWARLYSLGFNFQITEAQAFELLKNAADRNHIPSLIDMGLSYYSGTLSEVDKELAIEYWEKAANLGSTEGKVRLSFARLQDASSGGSKKEDVKVLKEAYKKGSILAQTALAYCYEKGIELKKSKVIASKYYRGAAQRGNMTALNSLKNMYDEIRPEDKVFQVIQ